MSEYIVRETGFPGAVKQEVVGELVRCGNCAHYIRHDKRCGKLNHGVGTSFYCAYGERRE